MLSLAHLREYEAEQAKTGVSTITEQEISPSPTSSSRDLNDGLDIQSHEDASSSTSEPLVATLQQLESSDVAPTPLSLSKSTEEVMLVPKELTVVQARPSDFGNRVRHARSRLCRSMGVEPNDIHATCSLTALLKTITSLRLKSIPHQGSPLDRCLRQAERFARTVGAFVNLVGEFDESAHLGGLTLWGCCEILLKVGLSRIHIVGKVLSSFDQVGSVLQRMISDCTPNSHRVTESLREVTWRTLDLCCEATWSVRSLEKVISNQLLIELEAKLEAHIEALFDCASRLNYQLWQLAIEDSDQPTGPDLLHNDFIDIQTLRTWLGANDTELGFDLWSVKTSQEDCPPKDWLQLTIDKFYGSENNILQICGPAGCGKSRLLGRLARLVSCRKQKDAKLLCFRVNAQTPSQSSSLSLIKGLVLQFLDSSIGNLSVYRSLGKAYRKSKERVCYDMEEDLWIVLKDGLVPQLQPIVIVVDGLDQLDGGIKATTRVRERLQEISMQKDSVRCILLLRPGLGRPPSGVLDHTLDISFITEEIRLFIEGEVRQAAGFAHFSAYEREMIIRRVLSRNLVSFSEAKMLLRYLELSNSYADVLHKLAQTPRPLSSILDALILKVDFNQQQTSSLMSWLLVGENLYTVAELEMLTGRHLSSTLTQITNPMSWQSSSCNSIVEIQRGRVQLIHPLVKDRFRELASHGKVALTTKAAHKSVTLQSLAYIKRCLPADTEPTFYGLSPKTGSQANERLNNNKLFVHCVTSYFEHYQQSDLQNSDGRHAVCPANLKEVFLDSVTLAQAEYTYWKSSKDHESLEQALLCVLKLRRSAFGERSRSIIQNLAAIALVRNSDGSHSVALGTLFEAWVSAKDTYGEASTVCKEFAQVYHGNLQICRKTPGFHIPRDAERIFKSLWETLRNELGDTDSETLRYGQDLARLYVKIQRLDQAATLLRILHQACLGSSNVPDERIADLGDALVEVLEQMPGQEEEIQHLLEVLSDTSQGTLTLWHPRRVRNILHLVNLYVKRQALSQAERKLRDYLEQLDGVVCPDSAAISLFIGISDVTLRLGQLLSTSNRIEEATQVLVAYWRRYEQGNTINGMSHASSSALPRFRIVAEELITLGASSEAKEILTRIRAWHFANLDTTSDEALFVALALARCCHLIPNDDDAGDFLKELYDTLFSGDRQSDGFSASKLTVCIDLASLYKASGRVADAIDVCLQALRIEWASILENGPFDIVGARSRSQQTIHIAVLLAGLYKISGREDEMHTLSRRLRQTMLARLAALETTKIDEADWFSEVVESLGMLDEALFFWKELRAKSTAVRPHNAKLSLKVAFHLARLYRELDHAESEGTLIDIIDEIGHEYSPGTSRCRFEAIMSLCKLYEKQQKYSELRKWYLTLWSSFLNQRDESGVSGNEGLEIFHKYVAVLMKLKDTFGAIRIARELRAVFLAEFGASDPVAVKAAMELAALLEQDAESQEEAVSIYEEICKFSLGDASTHQDLLILVRSARDRLAHLLATQPDLAHRAELIFIQDWEEARTVFGCSSEETLASLIGLIGFYRKHYGRRYTNMALEKVEMTVHGIITQEQDLRKLFSSAEAVAKIYIDLNAHENAFLLLRRIRSDISTQYSVGFLRNGAWVDRRWTVFATALEAILRKGTGSTLFTDIISDLVIETSLHESWVRVLQSEATLETRLLVGGKLLAFLSRRHPQLEVVHIRDELWGVFRKELSPESPKSGAIWALFEVCVAEMSRERSSATLLETAVQVVVDFCQATKYQQAFELARWIKEHVRSGGGFKRQGLGSLGIKLSICLINVSVVNMDSEFVKALQSLSMDILSETLVDMKDVLVDLRNFSIKQINVFMDLFGKQKNYKPIEQILQILWDSRTNESRSLKTNISIGRRLCEVKFALQHHTAALSLLEDICYNLRDVLGSLDPITLECERLWARLNTQCGNHKAAMDIHTHVLQSVMTLGKDRGLSRDEIAAVGVDELKNLRKLHWTCGGWGKVEQNKFTELSRELVDTVGGLDEEIGEIVDVSSWSSEASNKTLQHQESSAKEAQTDFGIEDDEEGLEAPPEPEQA